MFLEVMVVPGGPLGAALGVKHQWKWKPNGNLVVFPGPQFCWVKLQSRGLSGAAELGLKVETVAASFTSLLAEILPGEDARHLFFFKFQYRLSVLL